MKLTTTCFPDRFRGIFQSGFYGRRHHCHATLGHSCYGASTSFLKVIFLFLFIPSPSLVIVFIKTITAKTAALSHMLASLDWTHC